MPEEKISFLFQKTEDFESLNAKNAHIQSAQKEWIGFGDGDVTSEEELRQILEENSFLLDYDVVLFGENVPDGECDLLALLQCPKSTVYGLLFRKELLTYTGSYNTLLSGDYHYEFLLRLAGKGKVYAIPCSAEKVKVPEPKTMAYIVRRYMETLKEQGALDATFMQIVRAMEDAGRVEAFKEAMDGFLSDTAEYERIATDTAPCLIFISEDNCCGVVTGFGNHLADALVELGQAVITTNDRYGEYSKRLDERFLHENYKAIIGFQAPALTSDTFANMRGKRFQFWFDDPVFSAKYFNKASKDMYVLCQDMYYADYIKEHFGFEKAIHFPLAGVPMETENFEKKYAIVFVGRYMSSPTETYEDEFVKEFYRYMLNHVDATVEQGVRAVWRKRGIQYEEDVFMSTVESLREVYMDILQIYRTRVMEAILSAGLQVHVFSPSWRAYCGDGKENLIVHPEVIEEDALRVWSQAKIGLNIMNGHKGGMTERVANIMLCGACCLSDETAYLKEHFTDGEDIVLLRADEPDLIVEKIRHLLLHEEERQRIALAGRKKALENYTWRKRAEELLKHMEE